VFATPAPVLLPAASKDLDEARARLRADPDGGPVTQPLCAWGVPMLMMQSPLMFEALITPRQTALVFSGREVRAIHTHRRAHPAADDLVSPFWGPSVGHWEGETLAIDTVGVESPFVPPGVPMVPVFIWGLDGGEPVAAFTSQAHYSERMRLLQDGRLEDRLT